MKSSPEGRITGVVDAEINETVTDREGRAVAVRVGLADLSRIGTSAVEIETAFSQQVGLFAWWSWLETCATLASRDAQDALDALEADLLARSEAPKATVTELKAAARRDAGWRRLHEALRTAQAREAMIRVGRKTIEERKDCLKELAELLKSEMATGLERGGVRGNPAVADALRRQRDRMKG